MVSTKVIAVVVKGVENSSQPKKYKEWSDDKDQHKARVTHAGCLAASSSLSDCMGVYLAIWNSSPIMSDILPLETHTTCLQANQGMMWQDNLV